MANASPVERLAGLLRYTRAKLNQVIIEAQVNYTHPDRQTPGVLTVRIQRNDEIIPALKAATESELSNLRRANLLPSGSARQGMLLDALGASAAQAGRSLRVGQAAYDEVANHLAQGAEHLAANDTPALLRELRAAQRKLPGSTNKEDETGNPLAVLLQDLRNRGEQLAQAPAAQRQRQGG